MMASRFGLLSLPRRATARLVPVSPDLAVYLKFLAAAAWIMSSAYGRVVGRAGDGAVGWVAAERPSGAGIRYVRPASTLLASTWSDELALTMASRLVLVSPPSSA